MALRRCSSPSWRPRRWSSGPPRPRSKARARAVSGHWAGDAIARMPRLDRQRCTPAGSVGRRLRGGQRPDQAPRVPAQHSLCQTKSHSACGDCRAITNGRPIEPASSQDRPRPVRSWLHHGVEGEPLVDQLRRSPLSRRLTATPHAPGAFGTGWPRATKKPLSDGEAQVSVTLNCGD